MRINLGVVAAACAALVVPTGIAAADVVSIIPSADNTLYFDLDGARSLGSGPDFFVGVNGGGLARRGVMKFDVAGAVPPGSTITAVTLRLRLNRARGSAAVSLHRLLASWGEGPSTADGNGGGGGFTTPGDATWMHRFAPNPAVPGSAVLWTTPGGDFDPVASGSQTVGSSLTAYTWASTPRMVADVQSWLDSPSTNYGWLLKSPESGTRNSKRFDSRSGANQADRPTLTITFTPPAPQCETDFDHNGSIQPADVAGFVNAWFTSLTEGTLAGDFNNDGTVTPADVAAFVGVWFTELGGQC